MAVLKTAVPGHRDRGFESHPLRFKTQELTITDKRVDEYIEKQKSPQKEICRKLRGIIRATISNANEEMKWGVPAFADGKFYIVALKDHVNMGFSIEGLTKEELSLFDGGGKTTKHIAISSLEGLDENRIIELLKLVYERRKE